MDKDFKDLLSTFNAHNVQYLIVGGYAYSEYTEPRTTKDLDLFIGTSHQNAAAVFQCLQLFGANLTETTTADFENPKTIFQIGVAPFASIFCAESAASVSTMPGQLHSQEWSTMSFRFAISHWRT